MKRITKKCKAEYTESPKRELITDNHSLGGCDPVGRAGHLVVRRPPISHPKPQIAPDEQLAPCMAASIISVAYSVKCFELSLDWKSPIKMQTIYS